MKSKFWYIFLLMLFLTGCRDLDAADEGTVEKIRRESRLVNQSAEDRVEKSFFNKCINTVHLAENDRLKYHTHFGLYDGYVYYKDTLIVEGIVEGIMEGEIYKREEECWKKAGMLKDYLGLEEIDEYIQFERYLILLYSGGNGIYSLILADMEDWTYRILVEGVWIDFYIHEGKLLYASEAGVIMQLELPDGEPEQFEAYREAEITEGYISHFAMREDGSMVVVKGIKGIETGYWLWKKSDTGQWIEKKLMVQPDDWKYVYTFDYNERGFIIEAHPYNWIEEEERTINSGHGAIQESGEIQEVFIPYGPQVLPIDDSYFTVDEVGTPGNMEYEEKWIAKRRTTSVSQYDYEGNKINTYVLCRQKIIEAGFYLKSLIYEDGKLIGFYEHELTGELYITQVRTGNSFNEHSICSR